MNKWKYKILIQSLQDSCNAWAFEGEETYVRIDENSLNSFRPIPKESAEMEIAAAAKRALETYDFF